MKKMYLILTFILSSFFFSSIVSASTYNFTVNQNAINLVSDLPTIKNTIETYISQNSNTYSNNYIFVWSIYANLRPLRVYIWKNGDINSVAYSITVADNGQSLKYISTNSCDFFQLSSDYLTLSRVSQCSYSYSTWFSSEFPVYSSFNLYYSNSNNIFNYNFEDTTFTEPTADNLKFSTIKDMYDMYYSEPDDNYPILTEFYTVFIDKIKFTADYISHNYVFLSVFVVFLFMFSILLFRRLK